jgi:hypothetical protein
MKQILPPSIALTVDVLPKSMLYEKNKWVKLDILPASSRPNTPMVIFLEF